MNNILEVEHLCKSFPSFELQDISFAVPEGSIMGFIGENGAGKTTTIKLIFNLLKKEKGTINLFGKDSEDNSLKYEIGTVLSEGFFPDTMEAAEIALVMQQIYPNFDRAEYNTYCDRFQLPMKKQIKEFSTGMKMKCRLAAALAHYPRLLILDEPTAGLDPVVRNEILDIFLEYIQNETRSIFFSTHITEDIEKIADYVTFIHQGKLIFSRQKDELMSDYGILKCSKNGLPNDCLGNVLFKRENQFGAEYLLHDRHACTASDQVLIEPAALDEIMLFYAKGETI